MLYICDIYIVYLDDGRNGQAAPIMVVYSSVVASVQTEKAIVGTKEGNLGTTWWLPDCSLLSVNVAVRRRQPRVYSDLSIFRKEGVTGVEKIKRMALISSQLSELKE